VIPSPGGGRPDRVIHEVAEAMAHRPGPLPSPDAAFHALPRPLFERRPGPTCSYQPTGTGLARVGQEPFQHLWGSARARSGSSRGQTPASPRGGGDVRYTSLIAGKATLDVIVEEELVAYRDPAAAFRKLLSDAHFARHFAVGLSERLRASSSTLPWHLSHRSSVRFPFSCGGTRSGSEDSTIEQRPA